MAGGFAVEGGGTEFEGKITPIVIISCIMAATGGLMFGYDIGVSGGVTAMDDFLEKFFPVVYRKTKEGLDSNYCKYDNQGLQLFTSSLYLAGLTSTFFASYTTRKLGRKLTMFIAGIFFLIGVVLNAAATDLAMLIAGRILLGCGVGFANQAVPVFLSEIAPTRIRGGLNILFQLNVTIGILFANLVNYGTDKFSSPLEAADLAGGCGIVSSFFLISLNYCFFIDFCMYFFFPWFLYSLLLNCPLLLFMKRKERLETWAIVTGVAHSWRLGIYSSRRS